jgi:zinc transport system substrate-binding protein
VIIILNLEKRWFGWATLAFCALVACTEVEAGTRTAVASIYPLAFVTEEVTGPGWEVIDLTPPGTEAHDVELSLADRADLQRADLLVYLGPIGFQPQVEGAARELDRPSLAVANGLIAPGEIPDPHVWLDPSAMAAITERVSGRLSAIDPSQERGYRSRAEALRAELTALDAEYKESLSSCRHDIVITSHEAFGYLTRRYGLRQVGLTGPVPESEPTAGRLQSAEELLRAGRAGAVFFEASGEARRIAETLADDTRVPALPLSTLESRPPAGDYLSVMEDNLASLRAGLECR